MYHFFIQKIKVHFFLSFTKYIFILFCIQLNIKNKQCGKLSLKDESK